MVDARPCLQTLRPVWTCCTRFSKTAQQVLAKPRNKSALGEPLRAAAAIEADYVSIPPLPAGSHNLYVTDDVST
jgi:hypothetical protein